MRQSFVTLLLLCATLLRSSPASAQLASQHAAQLQTSLEQAATQYGVHGLTAAVLFPDQSVWAGAAGVSTPVPVDSLRPTDLLGIGSITKTFTAALVLRLVARGQVGLDDSIGRYVPQLIDYPNIDPGVTVRQLLSHTGGVYNYTNSPQFVPLITGVPDTTLFTPADILAIVGPMRFTPGTAFEYSNTGYILLGLLVEHVTDQPLTRIYRRELLDPLQLTSTWRGYADTLPANLRVAHGWIQSTVNGPFNVDLGLASRNSFFSFSHGDGELLSTPSDLVRWAQALYGTTSVLDSASLAQMQTVNSLSGTMRYGLGVMRSTRNRRTFWGHTGSIPGYMASFGYAPECGIAVAVMVNESRPIVDNALNRLFTIASNATCRPQAVAAAVETLPLALYPNPASGTVALTYACPAGTRALRLEVVDRLGRLVQNQPLAASGTAAQVSLASLAPGAYACRLWADDQPGPAQRLLVQ